MFCRGFSCVLSAFFGLGRSFGFGVVSPGLGDHPPPTKFGDHCLFNLDDHPSPGLGDRHWVWGIITHRVRCDRGCPSALVGMIGWILALASVGWQQARGQWQRPLGHGLRSDDVSCFPRPSKRVHFNRKDCATSTTLHSRHHSSFSSQHSLS